MSTSEAAVYWLEERQPTHRPSTGVSSETALGLRLAGASRAQGSACLRAGIYRAHGLRVNPRLRMLKTVYKANVDIIHVQRDETSSLFSVSERTSAGADSQPGIESQPDDPMGIDSVRPLLHRTEILTAALQGCQDVAASSPQGAWCLADAVIHAAEQLSACRILQLIWCGGQNEAPAEHTLVTAP